MRTLLTFSVLTLFALSACHKSDVKPTLTLSDSTLVLDSAVDAVNSFNITSNVSWTITLNPASAANWLAVTPNTGSNSANVKITITGHNTNVTQPVTLTVTPTGASLAPQTITLYQQGSLQVSNANLTLGGAPVTDTVTINTDLAWKATPSASWIHLDTTQGAGISRLKISVDTNRTGSVQAGTVTLTPLNNSSAATVTINVKQDPYYAILNFTPASGKVGDTVTLNGYFPADGNYTVTLNNSSTATILSHSATQIVFTVPSSASTGGYIFVNIVNAPPPLVSATQFTVTGGWKLMTSSSGLTTSNQPALFYTYNDGLYFGWGTTNSHTIYQLDTIHWQWTPAITIPSTVQVINTPTWFINNNKLYVGGGYQAGAVNFYEYDLSQGNNAAAWRSLTPLPEFSYNASAFAVGGYGYYQPGEFTSAGNNILYQFSTSGPSDPGTWTALGALNIKDGPAASFIIGNTAYIGGGDATDINPTYSSNTFFTLTPPSVSLTAITPIPEPEYIGPSQRFCTWTSGGKAYVFDNNSGTLWSYDPSANSWTELSTSSPGIYATEYNGRIYSWDATGDIWEYTGIIQ
ncbi:MAG TPA: BACON domain-containing carbohydrate-binding protein [Puia sp.]|nr:BACON domain-containing carbohydrate-binding protein [Puia sp.]